MNSNRKDYDPREGKGNYGPGGLSDQYDNQRFRSLDDFENPGGVTGIPFEDEFDAEEVGADKKGEAYYYPGKRREPERDADLGMGQSGTAWNQESSRTSYAGMGPKGWELSDEKLKERVSGVLLQSYEVDPSELEVTVQDKIVYLKGKIQSKGMKRVAEDLVASIPGVEDVFTDLQISTTSNFQIATDAKTE